MLHYVSTFGNEGLPSQWPHDKIHSLPNMKLYIEIKKVERAKDMFRKGILCLWKPYRSEVIRVRLRCECEDVSQ